MANIIKQVVGNPDLKRVARDSDKDGLMDMLDCQPHNPKKQGVIHNIRASIAEKRGNSERAEEIRMQGAESDARKENVRRDKRIEREEYQAVEKKAYKEERVKVAAKRGTERANRPSGFAVLGSLIQKAAQQPRQRPRARPVTRRNVKVRTTKRKATKRTAIKRKAKAPKQKQFNSMMDFKF